MTAPGQGQGGDVATGQQGNGGEGAETGQAPDFGALSSQLEQIVGGQDELRQLLASEPWRQPAEQQPAEPEQQQQPAEVDLSFLDPADPAYDPDQMGERLTSAFAQYMEQSQQQALAPIQQQMTEMRQEAELRDLLGEFPEIAENSEEIVRAAHEYASALNMPQAANEAGFLRLVFLAGRAIDAAQNEGSGDPGAAHLEGGGGANPGASQVDPVQAILKPGGKRGASVLDGI